MLKDAFDIPPDKQPVRQPSSHGHIPDAVTTERAAPVLFERVQMLPKFVGPPELHIFKRNRRVPLSDLCLPPQGNSVDLNAIINQSTHPHLNGRRSEDPKVDPRRGDFLEVQRIGEEVEYFLPRSIEPKGTFEDELLHFVW